MRPLRPAGRHRRAAVAGVLLRRAALLLYVSTSDWGAGHSKTCSMGSLSLVHIVSLALELEACRCAGATPMSQYLAIGRSLMSMTPAEARRSKSTDRPAILADGPSGAARGGVLIEAAKLHAKRGEGPRPPRPRRARRARVASRRSWRTTAPARASSVWAPKPDVHRRRSTTRRSVESAGARRRRSASSRRPSATQFDRPTRAGTAARTRPGGASWEGRSRSGLFGGGRRGGQSLAGDVVLCGDVHDGQTSPSGDGGGVASTSNSTSTTSVRSRRSLVARLLDQVPNFPRPGVGELELAEPLLDVRG